MSRTIKCRIENHTQYKEFPLDECGRITGLKVNMPYEIADPEKGENDPYPTKAESDENGVIKMKHLSVRF